MITKPRRVILIGVGKFGKNYLRILSDLHDRGDVNLLGIVVRTEESRVELSKQTDFPVYSTLPDKLLIETDVAFVVTPPETHYEVVKKCLSHCDVFVEKPIAENQSDAEELKHLANQNGRKLAVGHIFRLHNVTEKLKDLFTEEAELPIALRGSFINPIETDQGRPVALELLHIVDLVDFFWCKTPKLVYTNGKERFLNATLRYEGLCDLNLSIGWSGGERVRLLECEFPGKRIVADFQKSKIHIFSQSGEQIIDCASEEELLLKEIKNFLNEVYYTDAETACRLVGITARIVHEPKKEIKVAVVGGGIFGVNTAIELSKYFPVTLFERNESILYEGARINQFRHHLGYHYPRSDETVKDIQVSSGIFEEVYKGAFVLSVPTFYSLAREGSHVDEDKFIEFCLRNKLPFEKVDRHPFLTDLSGVCFAVPEPSYHYERMRSIDEKRLIDQVNIDLRLNTEVMAIEINSDGSKSLSYQGRNDKELRHECYDVVINTTYARLNHLTSTLSFPKVPIRIDLAEVLILELPIDPVSLTVLDGPFGTLMPTGNPNQFTLYHAAESILDRYVSDDGQLRQYERGCSNGIGIMEKSKLLFNVLDKAKILESRIVNRGVHAYREHDDNRVAEIFDHGFDVYSVLSGKIVTGVHIARKLTELVKNRHV